MSQKYNVIKTIIFNLILLIVLFLFAETLLHIFYPSFTPYVRTHPGQYSNSKSAQSNWLQEDNDFGWVLNRDNPVKARNGVIYKANKQGFRDDKNFNLINHDPEKIRIMILGDSFTFGILVKQENTFSGFLQKKLGKKYEVFNLTVPGWGVDQMYLAYKKYAPIIKPHVVILMFIDDDVDRSFEAFNIYIRTNKPSFRIKNDHFILRKPSENILFDKIITKSYILNALYCKIYRRFYSKKLAELIFSDMRKSTYNNNEKFIVLRCPTFKNVMDGNIKQFLKYHFLNFKKFFKKINASYLEVCENVKKIPKVEREKLYIKDNGHFTEKGNELIADYVITAYFEERTQ